MPIVFSKNTPYIHNLRQVKEKQISLVGHEARSYVQLRELDVPLPEAFALTSAAFDDFITSAGLVDKLTFHLSQVKLGNLESAKAASEKVVQMIERTAFPSILINPIVQAYNSLSNSGAKAVSVRPSWIFEEDLVPSGMPGIEINNISGEHSLMKAIKEIWGQLFSPQAILLRANMGYTGGISIAVLIQKQIHAEASGQAASIDAPNHNLEVVEIIAQLGVPLPNVDLVGDTYRVSKSDLQIIDRVIHPQEIMYLRRGRASVNETPYIEVPVSPEWRKHTKLSEEETIKVAEITKSIEVKVGYPVRITWSKEAGKFFVEQIDHEGLPELTELDLQQAADVAVGSLSQTKSEPLEIIPADQLSETVPALDTLAAKLQLELADEPQVPEALNELLDNRAQTPKDYRFEVPVILDSSPLTTAVLTMGQAYSGMYLDGTAMVKRHNVLPEATDIASQDLLNLIESYAIEISTASQVAMPSPLFYCLSDLDDDDRAQLLGEDFQELGVNGSERFLVEENALIIEASGIKRAIRNYGASNLSLVLPRLRSLAESSQVLNQLLNQDTVFTGLNMFLEISTPAFMHELVDIKPGIADGVILNLPKLAVAMVQRAQLIEQDYKTVLNAVANVLDTCRRKRYLVYVLMPPQQTILEQLRQTQVIYDGIILTSAADHSLLTALSDTDATTKVGRPQKPLF